MSDRSKPEDIIAQITELFMTVGLPDQLVRDESGKPLYIGETKFDDEFLESARLHFEPQLSKARLESEVSLNDWYMVERAIREVAVTDNLAELKKQWDELQKILDDAGDISVMTLFFELQSKAAEKVGYSEKLAVTTDPDALIEKGVSPVAVYWKKFSDKAIVEEQDSNKGRKAVTARRDRVEQKKLRDIIESEWDVAREGYSTKAAFVRTNIKKWQKNYNENVDFPKDTTICRWIKK